MRSSSRRRTARGAAAGAQGGRVALPSTPASTVTLQLFVRELDAAIATRESILSRAIAVVSTSGALVAVFLGVVGLVVGATADQLTAGVAQLPSEAITTLIAATVAFLVSGVIAVLMMWPRRVLGFTQKMLDAWTAPELVLVVSTEAEHKLVLGYSRLVRAARTTNRRLSWTLMCALTAEVIGVILAAIAVVIVVVTANAA